MMEVNYNAKDEVNEQQVADLLCTGFEGGINHWARIADYRKPEKVFKWDLGSSIGGTYRYVQYPMSEGGAVILLDEYEETEHELNLESIKRGLSIMANKYPRHYRNFIKDNSDAETGDVLIQCAVFGELVYG